MSLVDDQRARDRIIDELRRVEGLIARVERDLADSDDQDPDASSIGTGGEGRGLEDVERERVQAVRSALVAEREELLAALRRVEDGTYGLDQETGELIADERLEAVPAARTAARARRSLS